MNLHLNVLACQIQTASYKFLNGCSMETIVFQLVAQQVLVKGAISALTPNANSILVFPLSRFLILLFVEKDSCKVPQS